MYYTKQPGENLAAVKTVLCAPTGKAAYNIGGENIHLLFCKPTNQNLNTNLLMQNSLIRCE